MSELAEDIADLKKFLSDCGLSKAVSGRCAEALVVDHNLPTVAVMKRRGRTELTALLGSLRLSSDEVALVLDATHAASPAALAQGLVDRASIADVQDGDNAVVHSGGTEGSGGGRVEEGVVSPSVSAHSLRAIQSR